MSNWQTLLQRPTHLPNQTAWENWFGQITTQLLNGCRLIINGKPHRFVEVEVYYNGTDHPDTFTHGDPVQFECGRWYFHRTQGTYRSGSFKGLDLTFGDGKAHGGVLIRGIEAPDKNLIDGPSLCVDHLIATTGAKGVADLDSTIAKRVAWHAENPLRLEELPEIEDRPIVASARVGLTLKKVKTTSDAPRYIMKQYRFVSEPRRTAKGKVHMVLALHAQGKDEETIHQATGCPRKSIKRYVEDFEAGRKAADFARYFGIDLAPADLCQLHGTWHAKYQTR